MKCTRNNSGASSINYESIVFYYKYVQRAIAITFYKFKIKAKRSQGKFLTPGRINLSFECFG